MSFQIKDERKELRADITFDGTVTVDENVIAFLNDDGSAGDKNNYFLGDVPTGLQVRNEKEKPIGNVDEQNLTCYDIDKRIFAKIAENGDISDGTGKIVGFISPFRKKDWKSIVAYLYFVDPGLVLSGYFSLVTGVSGKVFSAVKPLMLIVDKNKTMRAKITADGSVTNAEGTLLGFLNEDGSAGDDKEHFLGEITNECKVFNKAGALIGTLDESNFTISETETSLVICCVSSSGELFDEKKQLCGFVDFYSAKKFRMVAAYLFFFDNALVKEKGASLVVRNVKLEEQMRREEEEKKKKLEEELEASKRAQEELLLLKQKEDGAVIRKMEEETNRLKQLLKEQEERNNLAYEEEKRKILEEAEKTRAEALRELEEAQRKKLEAEAEKRRLEELEELRKAAAEEQRRIAAEEVKRLAVEEAKRLAAEEAEALRVQVEERKRTLLELEFKMLAEAEERKLAEDAEMKRLVAETEARRMAEEVENARKMVAAEEAKRVAAEEETRRVAEEVRRQELSFAHEQEEVRREMQRKKQQQEEEEEAAAEAAAQRQKQLAHEQKARDQEELRARRLSDQNAKEEMYRREQQQQQEEFLREQEEMRREQEEEQRRIEQELQRADEDSREDSKKKSSDDSGDDGDGPKSGEDDKDNKSADEDSSNVNNTKNEGEESSNGHFSKLKSDRMRVEMELEVALKGFEAEEDNEKKNRKFVKLEEDRESEVPRSEMAPVSEVDRAARENAAAMGLKAQLEKRLQSPGKGISGVPAGASVPAAGIPPAGVKKIAPGPAATTKVSNEQFNRQNSGSWQTGKPTTAQDEAEYGAAAGDTTKSANLNAVAMYDYTHPDAAAKEFFSFKAGDPFTILPSERDLQGWKIAVAANGEKGFVPGNYLRYIDSETDKKDTSPAVALASSTLNSTRTLKTTSQGGGKTIDEAKKKPKNKDDKDKKEKDDNKDKKDKDKDGKKKDKKGIFGGKRLK